jgi:hypothetical protein
LSKAESNSSLTIIDSNQKMDYSKSTSSPNKKNDNNNKFLSSPTDPTVEKISKMDFGNDQITSLARQSTPKFEFSKFKMPLSVDGKSGGGGGGGGGGSGSTSTNNSISSPNIGVIDRDIKFSMKRPIIPKLIGSFEQNQKFHQQPTSELQLNQLKHKKNAFVFNTDGLSIQHNEELSSMLDNELNKAKHLSLKDDDTYENDIISPTSPSSSSTCSSSVANSGEAHSKRSHILDRKALKLGHRHHHHSHHSHSHHSNEQRGGKITISPDKSYEFKDSDLSDLGQIGYGEFGTVHKVLHTPSQTLMALKRIGPTVGNQRERKKVLKELDFVLECQDYEYVVKFYGVKFNSEPADCLICMELMDTSLEKFYKFVYKEKGEEIPESILGKIVVATVNALNYLKEEHKIIHRDVKPSNILVNRKGEIKMCDFGISGKLVDSIAASRDAGCQLYMAVSVFFLVFYLLYIYEKLNRCSRRELIRVGEVVVAMMSDRIFGAWV